MHQKLEIFFLAKYTSLVLLLHGLSTYLSCTAWAGGYNFDVHGHIMYVSFCWERGEAEHEAGVAGLLRV